MSRWIKILNCVLSLSACCISESAMIQLCRSCVSLSSGRSYSSSGGDPPSVLAEQVGKVMKITLNRPAVLNAQTAEMGDRLSEIVADVGGRYGTVGAVVVTGAGRAFSAGGDLKARA